MKKLISVFYLAARPSFYKILVVLLTSTAIQFLFFDKELSTLSGYHTSTLSGYPDLEHLISLSAINVIFAVTFVVILFLLSITGTAFGSKCNYTLSRLAVSDRTYFFLQTLYNFIILIILLCTEVLICNAFAHQYLEAANTSFISNQTIFLAFYRNEFLHSLLPLSDVLIWVRNFLQMISLSISASFFAYKQRRGKKSIGVMFLAVFSIIWNSGEVGGSLSVILTYLICVCMIVYMVLYVKNGWGENNEYVD